MTVPPLSANAPRVLIVDDDVKLTDLVSQYLRLEGMEVEVVHDGACGLERAQTSAPSLLVLDVMLPGLSGLDVLRRLRAEGGPGARLPVLMLTARGDELDKVLGLELGADDYLPKPFSSRELVARLRALLRRVQFDPTPEASALDTKVVRVSDVELNAASREVKRGGEILTLTSGEFDLLELLLRQAGEVVTREVISQTAFGRVLLPQDRSIDVHMSNLRRKLGPDPTGRERIKAVRGVGYLYAKTSP